MKKNVIYKSPGLYTKRELEEIKNNYDCRDITNGEYNDIDEEDLEDYNNAEWNYSFGDDAEWKQSWVNEVPVVIIGKLGLWNGSYKVIPAKCDSIEEAVLKCIEDMDEVEIYEDIYGNLKIDAYHHDGTNHFTIKKRTNKGNRCLNFREMWNQFLKEDRPKSNLPF